MQVIRASRCGGLDPSLRALHAHEPSTRTMGACPSRAALPFVLVGVLQAALLWASTIIGKKPIEGVNLTEATKILPEKSPEELVADARKKLGMDVNNHFNFAVVGKTGVGKSSLINAFRQMRDNQPDAAPVGEIGTTMRIQKYPHPTHTHVVLWDFPGSGTLQQPESTYFEANMLYAFDCILVLTADRFLNVDFQIAKKAVEFKRPCAFVRTKADLSVKSIAAREGKPILDASKDLRRSVEASFQKGLKDAGFSPDRSFPLFIVSAWSLTKKNPYALYDPGTGDLDRSLALMDEERLVVFVTNSVRFRLPKG